AHVRPRRASGPTERHASPSPATDPDANSHAHPDPDTAPDAGGDTDPNPKPHADGNARLTADNSSRDLTVEVRVAATIPGWPTSSSSSCRTSPEHWRSSPRSLRRVASTCAQSAEVGSVMSAT